MFIGICGGICAGKSTVAQYLVDHCDFTHLHIDETQPSDAKNFRFDSVDALLDYVTIKWLDRWVLTDIYSEEVLDKLMRRPFFILVSVDAPVTLRWQRYKNRLSSPEESDPAHDQALEDLSLEDLSLEDFCKQSDDHLYDPKTGLLPLISRATIRLLNTSSNLAHLYATLGKLDLTNKDRLRPNWDHYFMQMASLAAQRSNCMKRRVGCVLVREKRVIATGYNGTARGVKNCMDGGCFRCNDGQGSGASLSTCHCLHAEDNAITEAGRERVGKGAVLYCDTCPCLTCSIKIVQVGISEVVYSQAYAMDKDSAAIFREAGVRLRQFTPVSITKHF